jgi:hypothetical protein
LFKRLRLATELQKERESDLTLEIQKLKIFKVFRALLDLTISRRTAQSNFTELHSKTLFKRQRIFLSNWLKEYSYSNKIREHRLTKQKRK